MAHSTAQPLRQLQQADVALFPDIQAYQRTDFCGGKVNIKRTYFGKGIGFFCCLPNEYQSMKAKSLPTNCHPAQKAGISPVFPPGCDVPASAWYWLIAVKLSKSASWRNDVLSREVGGLTHRAKEMGFPWLSTKDRAMHAIPVEVKVLLES